MGAFLPLRQEVTGETWASSQVSQSSGSHVHRRLLEEQERDAVSGKSCRSQAPQLWACGRSGVC